MFRECYLNAIPGCGDGSIGVHVWVNFVPSAGALPASRIVSSVKVLSAFERALTKEGSVVWTAMRATLRLPIELVESMRLGSMEEALAMDFIFQTIRKQHSDERLPDRERLKLA
ncbi:hypothetical protein HDU93_003423, partial [Gonapodya sp. JEL0774]